MVQPPGGGTPYVNLPNSPDSGTPTPAQANLYWSVDTLWTTINSAYDNGMMQNTPQYLNMLAAQVNSFLTYAKDNPPSDKFTLQIIADLNQPLIHGSSVSIASLCTQVPPDITDMAWDFNSVQGILGTDSTGIGGDVTAWFNNLGSSSYPPLDFPTPVPNLATTAPGFSSGLFNLQNDIWTLQQLSPSSPDYQTNLTAELTRIAGDITSLHSILSGATSLDSYGQFLLNFISSPLDATGDSLFSLATAGGASLTTLNSWLTNPPAQSSPFTGTTTPLANQIRAGWLSTVMGREPQ